MKKDGPVNLVPIPPDFVPDRNGWNPPPQNPRVTELLKELLPLVQHEKDFTGQIIIYTGMKQDVDGNLIPLTEQDEDDLMCK